MERGFRAGLSGVALADQSTHSDLSALMVSEGHGWLAGIAPVTQHLEPVPGVQVKPWLQVKGLFTGSQV